MAFPFRRSATPANDAQALPAEERDARWLREMAARGPGATAALDGLVDAYEGRMLSFCLGKRIALADAEDLLQDLWIGVFENAGSWRGEGAPSSWIWRLLRNLIANSYRDGWKKRRVHPAPSADGDDDGLPEVAAVESDEARRWDADECVRRKLQEVQRRFPGEAVTMELRHLEDWSIPRIAAHIERTETATRRFLHTVRLKFRPHFQPCLDLLVA